jgi:hypothetical protein
MMEDMSSLKVKTFFGMDVDDQMNEWLKKKENNNNFVVDVLQSAIQDNHGIAIILTVFYK